MEIAVRGHAPASTHAHDSCCSCHCSHRELRATHPVPKVRKLEREMESGEYRDSNRERNRESYSRGKTKTGTVYGTGRVHREQGTERTVNNGAQDCASPLEDLARVERLGKAVAQHPACASSC